MGHLHSQTVLGSPRREHVRKRRKAERAGGRFILCSPLHHGNGHKFSSFLTT